MSGFFHGRIAAAKPIVGAKSRGKAERLGSRLRAALSQALRQRRELVAPVNRQSLRPFKVRPHRWRPPGIDSKTTFLKTKNRVFRKLKISVHDAGKKEILHAPCLPLVFVGPWSLAKLVRGRGGFFAQGLDPSFFPSRDDHFQTIHGSRGKARKNSPKNDVDVRKVSTANSCRARVLYKRQPPAFPAAIRWTVVENLQPPD